MLIGKIGLVKLVIMGKIGKIGKIGLVKLLVVGKKGRNVGAMLARGAHRRCGVSGAGRFVAQGQPGHHLGARRGGDAGVTGVAPTRVGTFFNFSYI